MKLKLNKKKLKNLSLDNKALPDEMTPNIAGGDDDNTSPSCGITMCWNCVENPLETHGCIPEPTLGAGCATARDCGGGDSDPQQNPYCNTDGCF